MGASVSQRRAHLGIAGRCLRRVAGFGAKTLRVTYKLDGSDTVWEGEGWSQAGDVATVKWRSKARWDGSRLILYTWNMALNQMRDTMALNGATLTIMRATEQPGPSGNGVLTYTKAS
jgi:hypothetical protein